MRPIILLVVDVASDGQVKAWAQELLANYSPPDLLINNAALVNNLAPLWEVSSEEFSQVIDVNIKGTANVIRHFVPAMIARKSGIVVNFSSGWGRSTSPEVAPYCASKWAIEGLTRSLAQELPPGYGGDSFKSGHNSHGYAGNLFRRGCGKLHVSQGVGAKSSSFYTEVETFR